MSLNVREVTSVLIPVRSTDKGHVVANCGSRGYLNSLKRIQHQQPEFAIKDVEAKDVVEAGSATELVPLLLKASYVGGKAVVADVPDVPSRTIAVSQVEATLLPPIEEVWLSQGWLCVRPLATAPGVSTTRQKKIPRLRIVERLGGCGTPKLAHSYDKRP